MKLCIPTLNRYDLLKRLIESAEAGTVKPSAYIIMDNGGQLPVEEWSELVGKVSGAYSILDGPSRGGMDIRTERAQIIWPGRNLGVAPSWNRFIGMRDPVIICNDDIVLKPDALEKIARELEMAPLVLGYGFALFGITPECVERVGYFDESFFPAYFEDCDYELRARRAGIQYKKYEPGELAEHSGWSTSHATEDRAILDAPTKNRAHFIAKWGGITGHCSGNDGEDPVLFQEPFNGSPPPGWGQAQRCPPRPMRWEIINAIAKKIGATTYLEIGVADGESMRHVDIAVKHGVDPMPSPGGQRACTEYFPYSSKYFFTELAPDEPLHPFYDIVFIDGDHQAELVYQEVEWALEVLSPKGVIVLHDCNPVTEAMQTDEYSGGLWNGTVWRAIVRLRGERKQLSDPTHCSVRVVDADYGVGIVVPGVDVAPFRLDGPEPWTWPYAELERDRQNMLGLLSGWEWEAWFEEAMLSRPVPPDAGYEDVPPTVRINTPPQGFAEVREPDGVRKLSSE